MEFASHDAERQARRGLEQQVRLLEQELSQLRRRADRDVDERRDAERRAASAAEELKTLRERSSAAALESQSLNQQRQQISADHLAALMRTPEAGEDASTRGVLWVGLEDHPRVAANVCLAAALGAPTG